MAGAWAGFPGESRRVRGLNQRKSFSRKKAQENAKIKMMPKRCHRFTPAPAPGSSHRADASQFP
jgi:hypothetical protein